MEHKQKILHKIYESNAHTYYCRAANAVFSSGLSFCHVCPLIGMSVNYSEDSGEDAFMAGAATHLTSCIYCEKGDPAVKDGKIMVLDEAAASPEQQKERVDLRIAQGTADDFPQFAFEEGLKLVEEAFIFAARAHRGAVRKGTAIPYIVHPMEAAFITAGLTKDPEIIAAAVLHDVAEDTAHTLEDIRNVFGVRVAQLVASESENKRKGQSPQETWKLRKQETIDRMQQAPKDTKLIALGDKLSNLRSIAKGLAGTGGENYWERFHQKDPKEHAWYHLSLLHAMEELSDTPAWKEYEKLCRMIFTETV